MGRQPQAQIFISIIELIKKSLRAENLFKGLFNFQHKLCTLGGCRHMLGKQLHQVRFVLCLLTGLAQQHFGYRADKMGEDFFGAVNTGRLV